jgi:enterochelin esterase-like enzyme
LTVSPAGTGFQLLAAALAVLAPVAPALCWGVTGRVRRPVVRAAALTLCLVTATVTTLAWLNGETETYPTWGAVFGGAQRAAGDDAGEPPPLAAADPPPTGARQPAGGSGRMTSVLIPGSRSGMTMPAWVYLPAAYRRAAARNERFPVIEALHGYPGSPLTWVHRLRAQHYLDQEINAGRMAPTIVVFPFITPKALIDTECLDLPGGPQAETYLTADVPAAIRARYRVHTDRGGWALIGFSAGGYCATNLLLRHPDQYAAAAGLSGYAGSGLRTLDPATQRDTNVLWRLRHLPQPAAGLYLACAQDDRLAMRALHGISRLAHDPLEVTTGVVARGGHTDPAWMAMEGPAFDYLSGWLTRPSPDR